VFRVPKRRLDEQKRNQKTVHGISEINSQRFFFAEGEGWTENSFQSSRRIPGSAGFFFFFLGSSFPFHHRDDFLAGSPAIFVPCGTPHTEGTRPTEIRCCSTGPMALRLAPRFGGSVGPNLREVQHGITTAARRRALSGRHGHRDRTLFLERVPAGFSQGHRDIGFRPPH